MSKQKKEFDSDHMFSASKAYDNKKFIHSKEGRVIRLLSEYLYPEQRFKIRGISKLIIFFGSARTPSMEDYENHHRILTKKLSNPRQKNIDIIRDELRELESRKWLSEIYEDAVTLSEMITRWSMSLPKKNRFYICTGGGPGMMEAANKGARKANGLTAGFNISLPYEQKPNRFISPELNFEFHYFFMRKFWFVYFGQALIVFPGGFGTLDELMEILTLRQTNKVKRKLPILLYSSKFWKNVINLDYLVESKMINKSDLDLFTFADTPEDAFNFIVSNLKQIHKIR